MASRTSGRTAKAVAARKEVTLTIVPPLQTYTRQERLKVPALDDDDNKKQKQATNIVDTTTNNKKETTNIVNTNTTTLTTEVSNAMNKENKRQGASRRKQVFPLEEKSIPGNFKKMKTMDKVVVVEAEKEEEEEEPKKIENKTPKPCKQRSPKKAEAVKKLNSTKKTVKTGENGVGKDRNNNNHKNGHGDVVDDGKKFVIEVKDDHTYCRSNADDDGGGEQAKTSETVYIDPATLVADLWKEFANLNKDVGKPTCKLCKRKLYSVRNLKKHINGQHLNKNIPCLYCKFTTNTKATLSRHIVLKHPKMAQTCYLCDFATGFVLDLSNHLVNAHNQYRSQNGDLELSDEAKAVDETEWKSFVLEEINSKGLKKYVCRKCNHWTSLKYNLKRHIDFHHLRIKNLCAHCKFKANSKNRLNGHVKLEHPLVKYRCDQCGYKTVLGTSIIYHLARVHHVTKTLAEVEKERLSAPIVVAGAEGDDKEADEDEEATDEHDDGKPKSAWSIFVGPNITLDDGTTKVSCKKCGNAYKNSIYLRRHILTKHLGHTQHCPYCTYCTNTRSRLHGHVKYVHKRFRHRCPRPGCDYQVAGLRYFYRHLHNVHHEKDPKQVWTKMKKESQAAASAHDPGQMFASTDTMTTSTSTSASDDESPSSSLPELESEVLTLDVCDSIATPAPEPHTPKPRAFKVITFVTK